MRAAAIAAIFLVSTLVVVAPRPVAAEDPALVLKVGGQDEMRTTNPLRSTAYDVWTHDVLDRVYGQPVLRLPDGSPQAYIAKGVDFDEDGTFESVEYNRWGEGGPPSSPLEITVYYDFNGVRWHDGTQADVWDLLFSYHLNAMHPILNGTFRVLFPVGTNASYEAGNRQLNVEIAAKNWEGEGAMARNPALRVAVRFRLTEPYTRFYVETLAPVLFPLHLWSGAADGRHADFGCAIYVPTAVAAAKGVPCGSADSGRHGQGVPPTDTAAFRYPEAIAWSPDDADVIGSGPFRFGYFIQGVEARVTRNADYYVGGVYDARLAKILKLPTIEGIRFLVYKTTQLGVFALQAGEIDFYHRNVGAEFVPDLLKVPEIAVESTPELGFTYLGYNLRREPWGYLGGNPANGDVAMGFWLRQAISHLVDKQSIVQNLFQNFAVVMDGFISPGNTQWYYEPPPPPWWPPGEPWPPPRYNLTLAQAILDDVATPGGSLPQITGFTLDPPGGCSKDTPSGCRGLPGIGTAVFELLVPVTDYPIIPRNPSPLADAMRRVGLNAVSMPISFGELANRLAAHDFDLYVSAWQITDPDPDYLYSFFHSSNAVAGLNYVGFSNVTFDSVMEASRAEMDRVVRGSLLTMADGILRDARPAEPLYARTNIEGYRQDRFVNWTVVGGTIWNYWSLLGIGPPIPSTWRVHLRVAVESAMTSLGWEVVTATVTDMEGRALPGAIVEIQVDSGTLTIDGMTGQTVSATTDVNGRVDATLRAPFVQVPSMILLQARASHPDLNPSPEVSLVVRVYPAEARFLSVSVELPIGDILGPGDALPVRLDVRDQDGEPMTDAIVNVTTTNVTLLRPSRTNGTAADLTTLTVEADASIANATTFGLTVQASAPGYFDAETSIAILVLPVGRTYRCPNGEIVRDLADCPVVPAEDPTPIVLAAGAAIAITAVAAVLLMRRRRRRRGPP